MNIPWNVRSPCGNDSFSFFPVPHNSTYTPAVVAKLFDDARADKARRSGDNRNFIHFNYPIGIGGSANIINSFVEINRRVVSQFENHCKPNR